MFKPFQVRLRLFNLQSTADTALHGYAAHRRSYAGNSFYADRADTPKHAPDFREKRRSARLRTRGRTLRNAPRKLRLDFLAEPLRGRFDLIIKRSNRTRSRARHFLRSSLAARTFGHILNIKKFLELLSLRTLSACRLTESHTPQQVRPLVSVRAVALLFQFA